MPIKDSSIAKTITDGSLALGWGGVFDLLENPASPDSSPRSRCTVFMDHVPVLGGKSADISQLAFWTADHCLNFTAAQSAELNLFDPENKKFVRFTVVLPALETFKAGLKIFQARVAANAGSDTTAESDFAAFQRAGRRESVMLNGAPLIERGVPHCISDTLAYKSTQTLMTTSCSTVLDLARVDAFVEPNELNRPEVKSILERLSAALKESEDKRFAEAAAAIPAGPLLDEFNSYLRNWRFRVSAMTRWRDLEGQSDLIEKVRLCSDADTVGICAQAFKDFFLDTLNEYRNIVKDDSTPRSYPTTLHDEVYADVSNDKMNLKWLLKYQNKAKTYSFLSKQTYLATNFLRTRFVESYPLPLPTLGDSGPLIFGLVTPSQILGTEISDPLSLLIFGEKTVMYPHLRGSTMGKTYLLQPGDSGSVYVIGNTPIGIIATTDGTATSGGASVRPLPEYTEQDEKNDNAATNPTQISCK